MEGKVVCVRYHLADGTPKETRPRVLKSHNEDMVRLEGRRHPIKTAWVRCIILMPDLSVA